MRFQATKGGWLHVCIKCKYEVIMCTGVVTTTVPNDICHSCIG